MSTKGYPISIRFVGKNIDQENGVPIYELAETLTAIQRLVYRAYLEYEHLPQQNIREPSIRRGLALQIESRKRGSDIYTLTAFLQSPGGAVATSLFTSLLSEIAIIVARYVKDKVAEELKRREKLKEDLEVEAIYRHPMAGMVEDDGKRYVLDKQSIPYFNEIKGLGSPVGRQYGVDRIEITFPDKTKPLVITPQFKKDLVRLENFYYFGDPGDVFGVVDRANVYKEDGAMVRVARLLRRRTAHGMYSLTNKKVFMHIADHKLFKKLITVVADYERPMLSFHGRPIHRVGDIGVYFKEFELEKFKFA
ncbi:hypothetical protein ANAEL_01814 [Anaerolineales bacterium]|nr:hypothetical protein ANAEL_01814 [Anaerolineales bacterium]